MGSSGLVSLKIVFPHHAPYSCCTTFHPFIPFYKVKVFRADCSLLHLEDMDHVYVLPPESVLFSPVVLVHAHSCFLPAFTPLFDLVQPAQFCRFKVLVSQPSRYDAPAGRRWNMGCRSPLTRLRVLLKAQYACCCLCISTHSLRPLLGASPLQTSRGGQLAFQLALLLFYFFFSLFF